MKMKPLFSLSLSLQMKMKIKKVLGGVDKVLLVEVRSGDGGSRRRWWRVLGEERGSGGGRGFQEATMMIDSGVAEMVDWVSRDGGRGFWVVVDGFQVVVVGFKRWWTWVSTGFKR
ncbi:hypothetical protein R6Q59_036837 [Mikania micrantha]